MWYQIKLNIKLSLLVFLLTIGIGISGIGMTMCRYQTVQQQTVSYRIKGIGSFFVENKSEEWVLNSETGKLNLEFTVSNTDPQTDMFLDTSHCFLVRWESDVDTEITMHITLPSGRVVSYQGISEFNEETNKYSYCFFDENEQEVEFFLEGNQSSEQTIVLETSKRNEAFLSEVILVDGAYDVEANNLYATSQAQPLTATSNYLSEQSNLNIFVEDSIDLSLLLNQPSETKIIAEYDTDLLEVTFTANEQSSEKELTLDVEANKETVVTLNVVQKETLETEQIVVVKWQLYNASNELEKELTANFIVAENETISNIKPNQITMEYVNEKESFSIIEPLELYVTSDQDTLVELKESLLPQYTRYSLDNGENWYILTEAGGIDLMLTANQKQHVMIDFSKTEIEWLNQTYDLSVYHSYDMLATLSFKMICLETVPTLELISYQAGVINYKPVSFTVNQSDITISIEKIEDTGCQVIDDKQYFEFITQDSLTYKIYLKTDVNLDAGTYQVNISNQNNDVLTLTFFVVETDVDNQTT